MNRNFRSSSLPHPSSFFCLPMAYIALYRKYRSQSFDELMGQEAVTRTLQNAIKSGRIAHAYLFHGARGCGKTSTARLIARALNCVAQDGPNPEPCGVCRLCVSIRDGACMDVTEIDAASETGVDNVREKIIENVQYAPGEARYKVYIIDEVHDLSAKAFDALLKTLEEPPAHVVFVLATTELHKVPITIRSRCQSYFFKRGTLQDLGAAIQRVVTSEGCTAEPDAILSIARSAEGSWRDALSLLEQVLAYSDGHITADTVNRAIGTVGVETLLRVTDTLARGQWDETLAIADELISTGTDVRQLLTALSNHLRDLMLISAGATKAAIQELGPERFEMLRPQAAQFDPPTLLAMSSVLSTAERDIRFTNQHRWLLESTLLRLLPGSIATRETGTSKREMTPVREVVSPQPLSATPTVIPRPPAPSREPAPVAREEEVEAIVAFTEPVVEKREVPAVPVDVKPSVSAAPTSIGRDTGNPPVSVSPTSSGVSEPEETNVAHRFADAVTFDVVKRAWDRILNIVRKTSPNGIAFLEKAEPVGLEGNTIILEFSNVYSRDRIQDKGRGFVEKAINKGLNTEGYKIRCTLADSGGTDSVKRNGTHQAAPASANSDEMEMLLDSPPVEKNTAPRRIADFDAPAPSSSQTTYSNGNGSNGADKVAEAPQQNSFLTEALGMFGGEVISTEERQSPE